MAKLIEESAQYRVIYDQDLKLLKWMDMVSQPWRHRYNRRTFPDYESARRGYSDAPEEWTDWIISRADNA
jgi:hypothetical protein